MSEILKEKCILTVKVKATGIEQFKGLIGALHDEYHQLPDKVKVALDLLMEVEVDDE